MHRGPGPLVTVSFVVASASGGEFPFPGDLTTRWCGQVDKTPAGSLGVGGGSARGGVAAAVAGAGPGSTGDRARLAKGRLHPVGRGVYAVGRPGIEPRWTLDGRDSRLPIAGRVESPQRRRATGGLATRRGGLVEIALRSSAGPRAAWRPCLPPSRPEATATSSSGTTSRLPASSAPFSISPPISARLDRREGDQRGGQARIRSTPRRYGPRWPAIPAQHGVGASAGRARPPHLPAHRFGARAPFPGGGRRGGPGAPDAPVAGSTGSRSTSSGRSWAWWSRPTGFGITARRRSRPATAFAIRLTPRPA